MNIQFAAQHLREDDYHTKLVDALIRYAKINEKAAQMLADKVASQKPMTANEAINIAKAINGLYEDGGGSTTGGGVTNGASFTAGAGEQYAGKKAFKKVEEDAPMLAHGKADIHTYTQDGFKKTEGHPKLKSIEPKNMWGTNPTAMSEMSLKNPGMSEFIAYLENHPEAITKLGFRKLQDVIGYLENANLEDWDELRDELNQIVGGEDIGIYEQDGINENYHRFKRQTKERPKQDQYHEAIKAVNKKLDEVNRILEFTSRMKEELSEGEETLEVKARTAKTMNKLKTKIAEAYKKLKHLN